MKTIPLRKRYFYDVARLGGLVLFISLAVLTAFNAVEVWEHAETRAEEVTEMIVLAVALLATLPLVYWLAWRTSGRLLKPLQDIQEGVKRMRGGELNLRLTPEATGDELAYLAESLNDAFDAHRDAQRRLEEFSANVSHQLRTPLTSMRAAGQVCLSKMRGGEEYRETMGRMLEESERLSKVVEQLLLLAKVNANAEADSFETLDLSKVTREVLASFQPQILDRGAIFELNLPEVPVLMAGNRVWLREAMGNLFNNALVYCPDPAHFFMTITQQDGWIYWQLEDGGPGFTEALRASVFGRFHRGEESMDGGSGLGLAIVADVAARHGGRAQRVESRLGGAGIQMQFPCNS